MGNSISYENDPKKYLKDETRVQKQEQKPYKQIENSQTILTNRSFEQRQALSGKNKCHYPQIRASKNLFKHENDVQQLFKDEQKLDAAYAKFQDKRKDLQLFKGQKNKLTPITFSTICSIQDTSLYKHSSDQFEDDNQSHLNMQPPSQETEEFIQDQIFSFFTKFIDYHPLTQIKQEYFIRIKKSNIHLDYSFQDKLGEGAFGSVYRCINKKQGQKRAVKILKQSLFINPRIKQQFFQQFTILKKINHPNIIKIFQVYHFQNMMYIISQLCCGGTLGSLMKKHPHLNSELIRQILLQLFRGIAYLHHIHILHRDIKPDNIAFLNEVNQFSTPEDIEVRIIDFGLAIQIDQKIFKDWAKIGTISYMAPEVFSGVYSTKCDIWSCGVVMYLLYTNHHPFKGLSETEIKQKIHSFAVDLQDYNDNIDTEIKKILLKMLNINYHARSSISEVMRHHLFKQNSCQFDKQLVLRKMQCYYRGNNLISFIQSYLSYIHPKYKQYISIFQFINKEQNGHISQKQFTQFILQIDKDYPHQQISYIFQKINKSRSGLIDYGEFTIIFQEKEEILNVSYLQEVFKFIDLNNNNRIQREEIKFFLKSLTKQEINGFFNELGVSRQNFTLSKFIEIIKSQI